MIPESLKYYTLAALIIILIGVLPVNSMVIPIAGFLVGWIVVSGAKRE